MARLKLNCIGFNVGERLRLQSAWREFRKKYPHHQKARKIPSSSPFYRDPQEQKDLDEVIELRKVIERRVEERERNRVAREAAGLTQV